MSRRGEGIYHRKADGLWEARYVKGMDATGKKIYGSVYAHSYKEAKEKRIDVMSRITLLPKTESVRRMQLGNLMAEWLFVNQGRVKRATYQKYRNIYENHIRDAIGKYPVIYLTPVLLRQFTEDKLKEGLSPVTINGILTFIGTCLKYGHRQYGTPAMEIIYLKPPRKEMRVLSTQEQNQLVEYLLTNTDIHKLGVLLALYTGLRIGELCALTWGDIQDGCVRVSKTMQRLSKGNGCGTEIVVGDPKSASSNRLVPLPSFLVDVIEPFRLADNRRVMSTDSQLFMEPRIVQRYFHRYISELQFPNATFHSLRHTFATRCMEAGFDVRSLSEILGHNNVTVTLNRYVHSSMELKVNNMEKLSLFV